MTVHEYSDRIGMKALVGSRGYGLDTPTSDWDYRGFYIAPTERFLGTQRFLPPEQIRGSGDSEFWELGKFLKLAMENNPNVLESVFSPVQQVHSPELEHLREHRKEFLSKKILVRYAGYAKAELIRFENKDGPIRWKAVMQCARLMLHAISIIQRNDLILAIEPEYRERLLGIRNGKETCSEVRDWVMGLEVELRNLIPTSTLPAEPTFPADEWLISVRLKYLTRKG